MTNRQLTILAILYSVFVVTTSVHLSSNSRQNPHKNLHSSLMAQEQNNHGQSDYRVSKPIQSKDSPSSQLSSKGKFSRDLYPQRQSSVDMSEESIEKAPSKSKNKAGSLFTKATDFSKKKNIFYGERKTTGEKFPIELIGDDDRSYFPKKLDHYEADSEEYDVIVVGGGLAGLTASLYLVDSKKKILLLQKQNHFGGLAAFKTTQKGLTYDRGASYWTSAQNEEFQLLNHIGMGKYYSQYIIPEPIDTYLWNGVLYGGYPHDGIWDDRTLGIQTPAKYANGSSLPHLPSSFAIFKLQCRSDNEEELIPDQPIEQHPYMDLDLVNAKQWIRSMPQNFYDRISRSGLFAKEKRLWARFQEEIEKGILNKEDPMSDVVTYLNLYSRSALGSTLEDISAMAFANFYIAQLDPRFTTSFGTGQAINLILQTLKLKSQYARLKKKSIVVEIGNTDDGVEVKYIQDKKGRVAKAKLAVYAGALPFAPNIVKDLEKKAPLQAKTMRALKMAHYSVHNAEITNDPYRDAYDTWVTASDATFNDFTDVILGRWVQLKGYKSNPSDDKRELLWNYSKNYDNQGSVISIYNSLMKVDASPVDERNQTYGDKFSVDKAEFAWNRFEEIFNQAGKLKQKFRIKKIVTNRWPYSVHIPEPGHFSMRSKIMGKTFGNVIFGNNNMGTPAFEEALHRGHCAANRALYRLNPKKFVQESWSKCTYRR